MQAWSEASHSATTTTKERWHESVRPGVEGLESMSDAVTNTAGTVIGRPLHNNSRPKRFCLVLSEKAEAWGWLV